MWLTSVGNKLGQVLISVLTAQEGAGLDLIADGLVMREELALHCRRRTNGEETTIRLLEQLLQELAGSSGNDSLGLIDTEWMEYIWHVQRKHMRQRLHFSGVLPFHLNRFIPGTSANCLNFQIYLLEGLNRWAQDRAAASLSSGPPALRNNTGNLVHCVNNNYEKLFGRKVVPTFCQPAHYTEETAVLIEELDVEEDREGDEGLCDLTQDPTVLDVEVL
ncbi:hypothetical protein SKAU_G00389070 [Synaphobranchus kaupii]|uniref:Uncharacterized protein n=1 Tax=Synaphobranchus kaupii TaxID=118154 RepID=A0A9Q1ICL1_SYNKA|nr:hypothetical protein SKAU_G00389070 [Synaphobranchus kaupii]